jgi:hypothetical protein
MLAFIGIPPPLWQTAILLVKQVPADTLGQWLDARFFSGTKVQRCK